MVSGQHLTRFLRWSGLWSLLAIAMASPRWDYTDIQLFRPGNDLLILLDISQSMNTTDVSTSRLIRARQEIADILRENRNARIGLVAFATLAHVVSPLTEDTHSLNSLLPALTTDLTKLKGSRLTEALIRARQLFAGQPDESGKHVLVISDGDFGDREHENLLAELVKENIRVHVLGIGTDRGGAVVTDSGEKLRGPGGSEILTQLDEAELKRVAEKGNGIYVTANFNDRDTHNLLKTINQYSAAAQATEEKARVWNDRFYWLILIAMISILPSYRWMIISPATRREGGDR
jgi:Ca-activated chloride channel family protein